jgi:hypothetical protein
LRKEEKKKRRKKKKKKKKKTMTMKEIEPFAEACNVGAFLDAKLKGISCRKRGKQRKKKKKVRKHARKRLLWRQLTNTSNL